MQATVYFYDYDVVYSSKDAHGFIHSLLVKLHRLFAGDYAHCAMRVDQWVFEFTKSGYVVRGDDTSFTKSYSVELGNPLGLLAWENRKPTRFGRLRIALSILLPTQNCAKALANVIGVRAKTPRELEREIQL